MNKEKLFDNILLIISTLIAIANALSLPYLVSNHQIFAFASLAVAILIALYLLRKDSSPKFGIVFLVVILVNTAIQFWGGATGSAAFLYPILFLWIKREAIRGPILTVAGILSGIEFLAPIVLASGLGVGSFNFSAILDVLISSMIAGLIPLLSMFAIEFLFEVKSLTVEYQTKPKENKEKKYLNFPDDIARSLIPLIKSGTKAHGVFLFTKNKNEAWTMNEFYAEQGHISSKYMLDYEEPLIQLMNANTSQIVHVSSKQLNTDSSTGLPWYINSEAGEWISIIQFRQDNILHGFIVVDYLSKISRKNSTAFLVDSAFILSLSWNLSHPEPDNGFLNICQELDTSKNTKTAIHKLISVIVSNFRNSTATVAVLEEKEYLTIFESMGPFGDARGWKKYSLDEGIAGSAIRKRLAFRRLKMGNARTFSISDDPEQHVKSCCAVPLVERGNIIGVLTIESSEEHHFTPEDLLLFKAYATVFGLAVSRNTMIEQNQKLRNNDRITGLPLLSVFHEHLKEIVKEVRKSASSISVFAVDIYQFDKINQLHGYSIGDQVLEKTADKLQSILSKKALLSKSGSNAFLICLIGVDRVTADAFAVRIHEEFSSNPLLISDREIQVSVCIGGAVSHVDRMITKLPGIALNLTKKISDRPGFSAITEVGPFFETEL